MEYFTRNLKSPHGELHMFTPHGNPVGVWIN